MPLKEKDKETPAWLYKAMLEFLYLFLTDKFIPGMKSVHPPQQPSRLHRKYYWTYSNSVHGFSGHTSLQYHCRRGLPWAQHLGR